MRKAHGDGREVPRRGKNRFKESGADSDRKKFLLVHDNWCHYVMMRSDMSMDIILAEVSPLSDSEDAVVRESIAVQTAALVDNEAN